MIEEIFSVFLSVFRHNLDNLPRSPETPMMQAASRIAPFDSRTRIPCSSSCLLISSKSLSKRLSSRRAFLNWQMVE